MATIVRHATSCEETTFDRAFAEKACPSAGYRFPCREDGTLLDQGFASKVAELVLNPAYRDLGVVSYTRLVREPVVLRCACRRTLVLSSSWANGCECGREYNGSGQELAPRVHWGEETGETEADLHGFGW